MRLARFQQLGKDWEVPESTTNQYNFDPKIVTIGEPKFSIDQTGGRITHEEFIDLRTKIIETVKDRLTLVKILFYSRFITAFLSIALCAFRLILSFIHSYHITQNESFILIGIVIAPNFIVNYVWRLSSKKMTERIQEVLNEENSVTYQSRGITWKISPSLHYMNIMFKNEANYIPPHESTNSLIKYPIQVQSPRESPPQTQNTQINNFRNLPIVETQRQGERSSNQEVSRGNVNPQITYDFRTCIQGNPQATFH